MEIIKQRFAEHITLVQQVAESRILEQVAESAEIIRRALQNGKKVLFCGNGGSAADSQHLAAEFVGRFQKERNGLPAIALTVDTSILTAVANDYTIILKNVSCFFKRITVNFKYLFTNIRSIIK